MRNNQDKSPADQPPHDTAGDRAGALVKVVPSIATIDAADWDACANPPDAPLNPFLTHAFLKALEDSGCVGPRTGWHPQHIVLEDGEGKVAACAPCYLKTHSQGEYVFDHAWADAYERAGGSYYPKLQIAVPFTPVPGRRLLVRDGPQADEREKLLAVAAVELTRRIGASSLHVTFATESEWSRLGSFGLLKRTDQQFHWHNADYASFDDFLASLASRKRKAIRKERATALEGVEIELLTGSDINERHWDAFFAFYTDTGDRKWGRPYLNRKFFSLLGETLADRCLLVMARVGRRYIAGALNLIGGDCLYGRYWGAIEQRPCLHFEICYHQAIDYAIRMKLPRVEAGAQGEHKLARGYLPTTTYSAHYVRDEGLRAAVARYLKDERRHVAHEIAALTELGPYRAGERAPTAEPEERD